MDDTSLNALRTELASDAATGRQLVADGATVKPAESWGLPLLGEDTQDFGPTPYYFEPAITYRGVYYPHFHDGTDIAVPDRKSTRLNSSHMSISYAVFCLKKKKK